ncbi:AAR2 domain protein [Aspergillus costaricaensis CBS 115574]|uniref:AAR2 domain protein n=1 Tax=Aspergillus costaricaensis CBS 115574 TaxID=1448317 RepID=A0ACD1ISN6_9EURO|nr:AAR2 domain protein [Aspergillus costaricaensis CBS 115574]RAK93269.1 AAR2 domain protein [Aspergillus costaricaensis CBS 115574]
MTSTLSPSPTILVPHLPPKTFVGIDLITFTSTPNFHGIRDLPSGWHFLYTGTTESLSLRSGGWFYVGDLTKLSEAQTGSALSLSTPSHPGADIIVWKWNTDTETLAPLTIDSDTDKQAAMRHKANLGAIWQRGGLFRYRSRVSPAALAQQNAGHPVQLEVDEEDEKEGRQTWKELTNNLTPRLLTRVVGDPALDVDGRPRWMVTSASSAQRDTDVIPGLMDSAEATEELEKVTGEKESQFGFLPVDLKRTWREGAIGRERTEAAQDRSWALGDLIHRVSEGDERAGEDQVLGELQFAFLMILTLMNYSCLQQWKRLLELILTCRAAIRDRETLVAGVLRLLLLQLKRCDDVEGGLFDLDGEEGGEFLRRLLVKFRRSLYEVVDGTESLVKAEFDKLEAWVKEEYDWELNREVFVRRGMVQLEDGEQVELDMHDDDEDDELGEYAPMVVDLGDDSTQDRVDMGEA